MACSSNNGLPYQTRSMLFKALHNLIEKSLIEKGFARLGKWFVTPYNLNKKVNGEDNLEFDLLNKLGKHLNLESNNGVASDAASVENEIVSTPFTALGSNVQSNQFNHVSYSFGFFLHGSSRVCTSVDMKLHRPIRLLNTMDLFKLKTKMSRFFSTPDNSSINILPNSLYFNNEQSHNVKFRGVRL